MPPKTDNDAPGCTPRLLRRITEACGPWPSTAEVRRSCTHKGSLRKPKLTTGIARKTNELEMGRVYSWVSSSRAQHVQYGFDAAPQCHLCPRERQFIFHTPRLSLNVLRDLLVLLLEVKHRSWGVTAIVNFRDQRLAEEQARLDQEAVESAQRDALPPVPAGDIDIARVWPPEEARWRQRGRTGAQVAGRAPTLASQPLVRRRVRSWIAWLI